jgi:hypothetical protein
MGQRTGFTIAAAALALVLMPGMAFACGGLVGENGSIQLGRTTTLAAYSNGVERYVTAFEFSGTGESVGSIIPLPDIPTKVQRGGDWTLQRLVEEVTPVTFDADISGEFKAAALSDAPAQVILEAEIDALDITVLKGGGDAVGEWALDHGFLLSPDAPEVLDFYAERSPIFMAAKFDAQRAARLGQTTGDSTPIMATIPTDDPWVPLRILGLGAKPQRSVEADVFLLTEAEPELLAGGPGLDLERSETASADLLFDLRSDKHMSWVPATMWLSYLTLDVRAGDLDYDLAIADEPGREPSLVDAGIGPAAAVNPASGRGRSTNWPVALGAVAGLASFVVLAVWGRRRPRPEVTL